MERGPGVGRPTESGAASAKQANAIGATKLRLAWAVGLLCSARVSPANGSDPKLHGQGPRAEARAARHLPRLTRSRRERDAGGVTRSGF